MRKIVLFLAVALLVTACGSKKLDVGPMVAREPRISTADTVLKARIPTKAPASKEEDDYAPHTLIIYYDKGVGCDSILHRAREMHSETLYRYNIITAVALSVPDTMDIHHAISQFRKVKGVLSVERDRILHLDNL